MFLVRSVCLSVCWITEKVVNGLTKFLGRAGTNEFNFGDDPDHRPD